MTGAEPGNESWDIQQLQHAPPPESSRAGVVPDKQSVVVPALDVPSTPHGKKSQVLEVEPSGSRLAAPGQQAAQPPRHASRVQRVGGGGHELRAVREPTHRAPRGSRLLPKGAADASLMSGNRTSLSLSQRLEREDDNEDDESTGNTVSMVLWACLAAVVSTLFIFVLVMAWMYCGCSTGHQKIPETNESLRSSFPLRSGRRNSRESQEGGRPSSAASLHSSATSVEQSLKSGDSGLLKSPRTTNQSVVQGQLPGLPLCPLLVVPDGTRLGCVVQNDVCRMKQELSFDVSAVPSRGGAPLFRARISELSSEGPAIIIETLGGRDQLAHLSTEDVWRNSESPVLGISRPWGLPYGTMQKGENGEYVVVRGSSPLLTFCGDYMTHSIQVTVPSGHTIATTLQTSPEEYQVHMQARTDAGLVILGLLAIDKCELVSLG